MRFGIIYTILTEENKLLIAEAKKLGVELERMCDTDFVLPITSFDGSGANGKGKNSAGIAQPEAKSYPDAIIQRSSSFNRSFYSSLFLEQQGSIVVNTSRSQQICADKAHSSVLLAANGVPTPKTLLSFSGAGARSSIGQLGFPCVIKPAIGSWGRMVHRLNDTDAADAEIESREVMGGASHHVYYLQEHVDKPGRDIRAWVIGDTVVSAIYRKAFDPSSFITNTSRGGIAEKCPVNGELEQIVLKATKMLDKGVYGVDLMEGKEGNLLVHEINHNIDFRYSLGVAGINIPQKIVEWTVEQARK